MSTEPVCKTCKDTHRMWHAARDKLDEHVLALARPALATAGPGAAPTGEVE